MSAALQYFEENLPHRPYHTDDLAFGLRISGKGRALLHGISSRTSLMHSSGWFLTLTARAAIDWSDRNAPRRTSPLKIL